MPDVLTALSEKFKENALWIILLVFGIQFIALLFKKRSRRGSGRYVSRERFMTDREQEFFLTLNEVIRAPFRVFAQVRIADVISVSGNDISAFNRISSKHVDFVIVDESFAVVCCIELDDKSHDSKKRRERDKFVDSAFRQAKVPLVRFRNNLSKPTIIQTITPYITI